MYISLSNMIFDAQRKHQTPVVHERYEPKARGEIRTPRAARRNGPTYEPIIRTFW